ncbi:TetR/AcrR family transcriptional regulator [Rhizobium sp. P40RR-XXII]|uniref:TetR/AcrR family transcriptional regulator n=1 Tax=unclassified Rhizobium TaxID=2613769 RepID=UPI00145757A6|nr:MULTISPECIES: TetR/AcrR family transcriptional regulator [unclassified Rhizobium]NLR87853.1 TetR/AcrR family transcriptional regulator [Rhizobium sp. P28RR-XV]NLS18513.1 TetR/AcrR family transcriptional regulator [Rhizobium sp. P40RR-XXII]
MGRTRSYDEGAVLSGAMQAFRRKGYRGASIRDLEDATGLKVGSIYHSFDDKAALFDAAFARYNRIVLRGRIERFAPAESGLDGLRALFVSLLHEPNDESLGCLITNSAVELGGEGPPHRCIVEGLHILTETFAERLASSQRRGKFRADKSPESTALRLLTLYQGILVLVRAGHDRRALEVLIQDEFNSLEAPHDPR